jgi:hypothetical protein
MGGVAAVVQLMAAAAEVTLGAVGAAAVPAIEVAEVAAAAAAAWDCGLAVAVAAVEAAGPATNGTPSCCGGCTSAIDYRGLRFSEVFTILPCPMAAFGVLEISDGPRCPLAP